MKRRLLRALAVLAGLAVVAFAGLWVAACETTGKASAGGRLERMQRSPQWRGDRFGNVLARHDGSFLEMTTRFFFGGSEHREPAEPLVVVPRAAADYETPPASGLRVTWLGHSSLLLEIDGQRVLIDPVWGERASPFSFAGPKRFYPPPLPLAEIPPVDAVVISHDHYDHLDLPTVLALSSRELKWVVPLGVGAHLEYWGVPAARVVELDWWEETRVGALTLTATPARHFSGRSITFSDADQTLWAGWAIASAQHRVFYSGDTAMHDAFVEIGERLGPFDLTMFEVGAYNLLWRDVHLGPEQAVRAHQLVRGAVLLPVHWGLFDLALHGWTEPIERVLQAAAHAGVPVALPRPGDRVEPAALAEQVRWWPDVPWQSVEEAPAFSTGVEHLLAPTN